MRNPLRTLKDYAHKWGVDSKESHDVAYFVNEWKHFVCDWYRDHHVCLPDSQFEVNETGVANAKGNSFAQLDEFRLSGCNH
ncbi:hypothetical protein ACLKA7_002875 [Drosophila subpalustris]